MSFNSLNIRDLIKRGIIQHCVGDEVIVFHRKSNGYPRSLKDDVIYYVKQLLIVFFHLIEHPNS
jgi:hypothetical protein